MNGCERDCSINAGGRQLSSPARDAKPPGRDLQGDSHRLHCVRLGCGGKNGLMTKVGRFLALAAALACLCSASGCTRTADWVAMVFALGSAAARSFFHRRPGRPFLSRLSAFTTRSKAMIRRAATCLLILFIGHIVNCLCQPDHADGPAQCVAGEFLKRTL